MAQTAPSDAGSSAQTQPPRPTIQPRPAEGDGSTLPAGPELPRDSIDTNEDEWSKRLTDAVDKCKPSAVKSLLGKRRAIIHHEPVRSTKDKEYGHQALAICLFKAIASRSPEHDAIAVELISAFRTSLLFQQEESDRTPLHQAVVMGRKAVVEELLRHSECARFIDSEDINERAAVHEAAARGHLDILRTLLFSGAQIDVHDKKGMTPLHLTIWRNGKDLPDTKRIRHLRVVQTLITHWGAEVNTRDVCGDTPLHDACRHGEVAIIELLLSSGADAEARNIEGHSPQDTITGDDPNAKEARLLFSRPYQLSTRRYIPKIPRNEPVCLHDQVKTCENFNVYVRYYLRGHGISWATSTSVLRLVYEEGELDRIEARFFEYLEQLEPSTGMKYPAGPQLPPEPSRNQKDIWRWIHFPVNNMTWIQGLIYRITVDHDERTPVWKFFERSLKDREGGKPGSSTRIPHAEAARKDDMAEEGDGQPYTGSQEAKRPIDGATYDNEPRLSLVFPYIDFETDTYLNRKTAKPKSLTPHFRKMAKLHEVYPSYSGSAGLQAPVSLDSSYYDMLEEEKIHIRDKDQVVRKWFRSRVKLKVVEDVNELLKKYLTSLRTYWREPGDGGGSFTSKASPTAPFFWNDLETIATRSFTERSPSPNRKDLPLDDGGEVDTKPEDIPLKHNEAHRDDDGAKMLMIHQLWLWKLCEKTVITSCPSRWHAGVEDTLIDTIRQGGIEALKEPEDLIELIMYECATFLDEFRYAGVGDHVLDIFDSTTGLRADQEVECFKHFRDQIKNRENDLAFNRNAVKSITNEIRLLYELKDIRDEIHLIRRIFEVQSDVLEKLTRLLWPGAADKAKQRRNDYLERCGTKALINRTIRLDESAGRTLGGLDYLVQVKQAQSSIDEAERARWLNNYIMIFTVVTIIFAPLSFMTSLFAIPINEFPHNNDGNLSFNSLWLVGRMFAGELASLAVVGIFIAFLWRRRPPPAPGPIIDKYFDDGHDDAVPEPVGEADGDDPRIGRRLGFARRKKRYVKFEPE